MRVELYGCNWRGKSAWGSNCMGVTGVVSLHEGGTVWV